MHKFFVIKLFNQRTGERGYVVDGPNGIMIDKAGIAKATRFKTNDAAWEFIKENKLDRKGVNAMVRDNQDLFMDKDAGQLLKNPEVYFIETENGDKCFYDPKKDGYYFSDEKVGWCAWNTDKEAHEFVTQMNFPFPVFVKKFESNKSNQN